MGEASTTNFNEKVDLNISDTFSLANTSSVEFSRTFSLSQKREVYLIHIECQSTEDTINSVSINATLNGIVTSGTFKDSSSSSSSPHTYVIGTTLTMRVSTSTPVFVLSNSININITVDSTSLFNSNKGNFWIQEVTFESLTPPTITSTSEATPVPLQVSQGSWRLSPLSMLKERQLESEIYAHIMEDIFVRIDVNLQPVDLLVSSTVVIISTTNSAFESTDSSTSHSIAANLVEGDTLRLNLRFRPSSEFSESIISVTLTVVISILPPVPGNNSPGESSDNTQMDLSLTALEVIRFLMIVVPLFIFYRTKKGKQRVGERSVPTSEN